MQNRRDLNRIKQAIRQVIFESLSPNDVVKNNNKLLREGKRNQSYLMETAGPGWFRVLQRIFGRRFTSNYPYMHFMERYANPPGGWPRRLIRINRNGTSQWGVNETLGRQISEIEMHEIFKGRRIKQLLINDEGAYVVLTDDGKYYYLHPENGPIGPLPPDWDPYRDNIPNLYGHTNWADEGYKGPLDPTFGGAGAVPFVLPYLIDPEEGDEEVIEEPPPSAIPPYLTRPGQDWHPPMN